MYRMKLVILTAFVVIGLAIYLSQPKLTHVAGRVVEVTLNPPTSVNASDAEYVTKVGIYWDTIRDATNYRIYRNTSNNSGSAEDLGTTAANYFFDATSMAGQTYFYWVRAENLSVVSPLSSPDEGMRAIGAIIPGPFVPLEPPTAPDGNEVTAAKAYLGKALFWDEQLSSTRTVSCGTCHRPSNGGSDPRTIVGGMRSRNPGFDNTFDTADDVFGSPGVPQNNLNGLYSPNAFFGFNEQVTGRKSPSYLNAGYPRSGLFWDGRATDIFRDQLSNNVLLTGWASLESQTAGPPVSSAEMAHTGRNWSQVAERIVASKPLALARNIPLALKTWIGNRTYAELFAEVFGTPDVTPARISFAIATHERTLFSDRTPLDKAVMQIAPLTAQEIRGQDIFVNQLCIGCHGGVLLSDQNFHNIGVRPQAEDSGRLSVTGLEADRGRFKTPNLRNLELRGPFMHNGRFETVGDVVEFYNRGGDFDAPNIDHDLIRPLNMTFDEKADLAAFLKRPLTDPRVVNELPPFDRPQLYTESTRVPQVSGVGRSGSGGLVPRAIAIEPPLVGNPSFTIAVSNCLGNAAAVLVVDSADPGIGVTIPAAGSFARVSINLAGVGSGTGFGSVSLAIPDNSAIVGQTFFGRWYVMDAVAANGFSVSQVFQFTIFRSSSASQSPFDYDGDGKSDISVFRPTTGAWYLLQSQAGFSGTLFGNSTDRITPADFDGDGKTDIAVYRPSTGYWYVVNSSNGTISNSLFGIAEDLPAPGDFDGDGRADLSVFRPSTGTWYRTNSSTGAFVSVQFGASGDKPTIGDFDGDGKADIAVYRPSSGSWYRLNSSTGAFVGQAFGISADVITPADFDGDGKADIAVYRPSTGTWYILGSSNAAFRFVVFGLASDIPAAGDFDGDGKADVSVFRPSEGTWYWLNSSTGVFSAFQFGAIGDKPTPSAFEN